MWGKQADHFRISDGGSVPQRRPAGGVESASQVRNQEPNRREIGTTDSVHQRGAARKVARLGGARD
jgi:hypothetical protein